MNKEDIICTHKEVDLDKKERDMIEKMVLQWRLEYANVDGNIIRKTDLKNHSVIVVKLIIHNTLMALADVNVNNEKKELTGIRMLRFQGRYIYQKYTFYLDGYRRKWIAYTRL